MWECWRCGDIENVEVCEDIADGRLFTTYIKLSDIMSRRISMSREND